MNRVAVTGIGAICGLGHNLAEIWSKMLAGESAIGSLENIEKFEKSPIKIAGLVKDFVLDNEILEASEHRKFDTFIHYALKATDEALKQSGLVGSYENSRIGSILGVGLGGFPMIEDVHATFLDKGPRRVTPFFIPGIIPNMATGLICIKHGFTGVNFALSSACASASHAIDMAATQIMMGRQDAVITGGAECVTSSLTLSGFASMRAVSKRTDHPEQASRPFDKNRDGFVMGDGAGILILENYEKAKKRGATILAEIVGLGASSDANHITAPHPEGMGAILAMEQALKFANIDPSKIDYINAHGTSTPLGDVIETKAIKDVFKEHAKNLVVSSTKSMTGHLLGAAGGLESVVCVKTIMDSNIPPTINLDEPDEKCDLNYSAHKKTSKVVHYALNNSFGFGGTNSCSIFKKDQG